MAKKLDQKAAVLAAAQGSGAVFEALNDDVVIQADEAAEPVKAAAPAQEEAPEMTAQIPTMDFKAAADAARNVFAKSGIDAKAFEPKSIVARSQTMAQEAAELARGNVEAMAASARIAAQNAGTLSQDVAELGRRGFETTSEALKGFAAAKSPSELLRLQSEFAKSYMETMISEGAKLSETMVKLAGEAMEPVSSRFQVAAEKAKSLSN